MSTVDDSLVRAKLRKPFDIDALLVSVRGCVSGDLEILTVRELPR